MIQLNKEYLDKEENIYTIVQKAKEVLAKRQYNYERYARHVASELKTPLEYYIDNIGAGYFGGKAPKYSIKQETNEQKKETIQRLFGKEVGKNANADEFQMLIDYIRDYNDDPAFFYNLVFDYMVTGACYWLEYETEDNEIVYANLSSRQCVAIYDFSTPVQKIAGLRIWQETDADGFDADMVEVITDEYRRYYKNSKKAPKEFKEDISMREDVKWYLVPFNAVENPDGLALHEPVITLIDTYETVLTNNKHLFEYNDDAKLKITGFMPENPLTITDVEGNTTLNPARKAEDEAILQAPTFYTPDASGNIEWIIKDINDTASENHKKTLVELILMCSMIPSISEISTKEKTATEIERSFFPLEQVLTRADKLFKKELLAMWENIVDRINVKKNTNFDFREINIELQRNLPTDKQSMIDMALRLREVLSDETVLNMLPLDIDVESELAKKEEQSEENMFNAIMTAKNMKKDSEVNDELENDRQDSEELPKEVQE